MRKNPPAPAHYLLFQHLLHICLLTSNDSEIHLLALVTSEGLIHNHYKPCKYLVMFKKEASVKDGTECKIGVNCSKLYSLI